MWLWPRLFSAVVCHIEARIWCSLPVCKIWRLYSLSRSRDMVGAYQNLNGYVTWPWWFRVVCWKSRVFPTSLGSWRRVGRADDVMSSVWSAASCVIAVTRDRDQRDRPTCQTFCTFKWTVTLWCEPTWRRMTSGHFALARRVFMSTGRPPRFASSK